MVRCLGARNSSDPPEQIVDSALVLSKRPGLGIKLNEKTAAKYAVS